jgi:hypothetical protein
MPNDTQPAREKEAPARGDWWRWLQILVIPLTTIIVGQYASKWQEKESARRTYADMMNRREEAESALRKDMFQSTILPFLERKTDNIEASVLRLELLAGNFHDSLDLSPLFKDVYRSLAARRGEGSVELMARLTAAAQEVVRREVDAIREASTVRTATVDLDALKQGPVSIFGDEALKLPGSSGPARTIRVEVLSRAKQSNEFLVRLAVWSGGNNPVMELQTKPFHLGPFDFPLIDNTRLSGGDRVALSFDGAAEDVAQILLIYFPGSRASMKDKQYYEDMAAELLRIQERSQEKGPAAQ